MKFSEAEGQLYMNTKMIKRFFKYVLTSAQIQILQWPLVLILTEYAHFWYVASMITTAFSLTAIGYTINSLWTWKHRGKKENATAAITKEILHKWKQPIIIVRLVWHSNIFRYYLIGLCGSAFNWLQTYIYTEYFGIWYGTSLAIGTIVVIILTFIIRDNWIWKIEDNSTTQRLGIFISHTLGKSLPLADRNIIQYLWSRAKQDSPLVTFFRLLKMTLIFLYSVKRNWKLSKIYCSKERFVVRKIHGNKMLLDLQDAGVSRELLTAHTRETFATALLKKELAKGNVVIDIGSSIGYYALQEAQLVKSSGIVYAIEPVIDSYSILLRNMAMNGYRNIKTFNLAIGTHNHNGFIQVSRLKNCSKITQHAGEQTQSTLIIPLDKFVKGKRHPDFVRMDVEGYETEIIKGMTELLYSTKPLKIAMELHCALLGKEMLPMLHTLQHTGFKVKAATIEAHPVLLHNKVGMKLLSWLDTGIGARTGFNAVTIDNLLTDKKYSSGQIDYMEILFEKS